MSIQNTIKNANDRLLIVFDDGRALFAASFPLSQEPPAETRSVVGFVVVDIYDYYKCIRESNTPCSRPVP